MFFSNYLKNRQPRSYAEEISVIASGVVVDNAFVTGSCDMVVRGILNGDVDLDGDVEIGPEGQINGGIECKNCTIAGLVRGDVSCSGDLRINEYGELAGDVSAAGFTIDRGGRFTGACNQPKPAIVAREA